MLPSYNELSSLSVEAALTLLLNAARSGSPIGQTIYMTFWKVHGSSSATAAMLVGQIQDALGLSNGGNGLGPYGNPSGPLRYITVRFVDELGRNQQMNVAVKEGADTPGELLPWDGNANEAGPFQYSEEVQRAQALQAAQAAAAAAAQTKPAPGAAPYDDTIDPPVSTATPAPATTTTTTPAAPATIFGFSPLVLAAVAGVAIFLFANDS